MNQVVWVKEIVIDTHQVVLLSAAKRTAHCRDATLPRRNSGGITLPTKVEEIKNLRNKEFFELNKQNLQ
jgi:hypothetical protein